MPKSLKPTKTTKEQPSVEKNPCSKKKIDEKKRKVIKQIRTLLNDYPTLHPLQDDFFQHTTLTLLNRLHLNLRVLDGMMKKNHIEKETPKTNKNQKKEEEKKKKKTGKSRRRKLEEEETTPSIIPLF
jgi:hypothetical protein